MDYTDYVLEQAIPGDGPILTDHAPASPTKLQASRRFARRDAYRSILLVDTEAYLDSIEDS